MKSVSENALMQSMTRFEARLHALQPERIAHALRHLRAGPVGAVERDRQILEELRAIGQHAGAHGVECLDRRATRIRRRLQHQRRHGADQHRFGDALRAVAADVTRDLAAAGRMADVDGVLQIQCFHERGEIVGIGVHVVAVPRLTGSAVAAAIVRDAAVAVEAEEDHLVFPGVGAERPAVAEDDGLSAPQSL